MYSSAFVWAKVLSYLEDRLGDAGSSWFDDAEVVELKEDRLILYSPNKFRQQIILTRCAPYIQEALKEIFNSDAKLEVYSDEEMEVYRAKGKSKTSLDFNPQFNFDNFIVGPSNRHAHGAAVAVAENPGAVYNPLFIYGPPGMGKTHLLYAIANELRKQNPDANIVYIKGDQFTIELIEAIRTGKNIEFRNKYREADLFLIDDIQFIAGKEATQEEFFHTFNYLYEANKQIVLTSDRPPNEMPTLEDRLKGRFGVGVMIGIVPPDVDTRAMIVRDKASKLGLDLEPATIRYISETLSDNVRQIEGGLRTIRAYHDLDGMPLTLDNIARTIDDIRSPGTCAAVTPDLIVRCVCKYYGVEEPQLKSQLRSRNISEPRQVAMYLIRQMTKMSFPDIGEFFGRDHGTVHHAVKKVEAALKGNGSRLEGILNDIQSNIRSGA